MTTIRLSQLRRSAAEAASAPQRGSATEAPSEVAGSLLARVVPDSHMCRYVPDELVVVRSHSGAHDGEDSANDKKQSTKDEQSP